MKFNKSKLAEVDYLVIDSWQAQGFIHGFISRDLNLKDSLDYLKAEQFFQNLLGLKVSLGLLHQIHCSEYIRVMNENELAKNLESDGWFVDANTNNNRVYLIKTADCIPVIIYHPHSKKKAILHCGWKGTFYGLLEKAIAEFINTGCDVSEIEIAVGPGADACCYQIGDDLRENLLAELKQRSLEKCEDLIIIQRQENYFLSLASFLKLQALRLGVLEENVAVSGICTICNLNYFSFRREKENAGRQISFLY